ncbi:TPA: leader peptide SpeFL [Haemophilus influenzae 10810]
MLFRTYIHRYVHTKALRLLRFNPIKGRSLTAHIRRTRHIMMPSYRSCFSYSLFASQNKPSNTAKQSCSLCLESLHRLISGYFVLPRTGKKCFMKLT